MKRSGCVVLCGSDTEVVPPPKIDHTSPKFSSDVSVYSVETRTHPRFFAQQCFATFCTYRPLLFSFFPLTLLKLSSKERGVRKTLPCSHKTTHRPRVVDVQLFPRPRDVLYNSYFVLWYFASLTS